MGVTLYELLTLQYLFQEPNRAKLIDRVMHDAPVSPRKLDKKVPRDLETIILKAIAKEPAQRYAIGRADGRGPAPIPGGQAGAGPAVEPDRAGLAVVPAQPGAGRDHALAIAGLWRPVVVLAISNARIARTSQALAAALREKDGALKTARESEADAKESAAEALSAANAGRSRRGAGPRRGR